MSPVKIFLFIVGVFVFTKVSQYLMIVKNLLNLRFKQVDGELKELNELPDYLEELLPRTDIKLQSLGFSLSHLHLLQGWIVSNFNQQWNVVYFNKDNNCYASVIVSPLPEMHEPVKVEFKNIFSDQSKLITQNGTESDIVDKVPNVILHDPCAVTLEQQYSAHIEKTNSLGGESIKLNAENYLADEIQAYSNTIAALTHKGYLKSNDEITWQLCLLPAMKHAFKILKGVKKKAVLKTAQLKATGTKKVEPIKIPVAAEVKAYLHLEDSIKPSGSGLGWKLMVFCVSLTVGMGIFGAAFSFSAALFIIAALIVHELGHYIAMVIFGYRNRQILFLPFGAATLGEKSEATALQKAVVFLSGPALGLIVGTVCIILGARMEIRPLTYCGGFFLVLNYLNLIPIVPLDGGRLFELALFSKVPVLKSVFLIVSLLVMLVAAIGFKDPILIIFSIFMIISLRTQILINSAHSKIKKQIKAEQIQPDKESFLSEIFQFLKQKSFSKLPFIKKYEISKNLVSELTQEPPGLAETIVSLVLYFVVFALPVFIAVPTIIFLGIKDAI
ncbi:site-2 protease family protein [Planctomycetota bacterium]